MQTDAVVDFFLTEKLYCFVDATEMCRLTMKHLDRNAVSQQGLAVHRAAALDKTMTIGCERVQLLNLEYIEVHCLQETLTPPTEHTEIHRDTWKQILEYTGMH